MDAAQDESPEGSLDVLIDLDIEAKRQAKFTIVTDPENDANIVGYTEGNLNFMLDDWEHMTLNGELEIVEGQYDFALGPFVRKSFVAKPGGRLFWPLFCGAQTGSLPRRHGLRVGLGLRWPFGEPCLPVLSCCRWCVALNGLGV